MIYDYIVTQIMEVIHTLISFQKCENRLKNIESQNNNISLHKKWVPYFKTKPGIYKISKGSYLPSLGRLY